MASDPWTGREIDGRYIVESMLGQGGMGVVLRARHRFTGARVALKMLRPDLQFEPALQERFLAEARASSAIGHPGIVPVFDAGKTAQGELYLVMELLEGRPLRQAMYPTMPPHEARRIVLELLDALGAAHARGIVHRDLKPENVFLVGVGAKVKLLDFGIAKVTESSTRAGGVTAAGSVLGTVAYMAPEQLTDASTVDRRADLWAVGVMLYELLSGALPYRGTHISELMVALASQEPEPITLHLPAAPPELVAFFTRALARDRNQRFATTQELAEALAQLTIDDAAAGAPASPSRWVAASRASGGAAPTARGAAGHAAGVAQGPLAHAMTQATGSPAGGRPFPLSSAPPSPPPFAPAAAPPFAPPSMAPNAPLYAPPSAPLPAPPNAPLYAPPLAPLPAPPNTPPSAPPSAPSYTPAPPNAPPSAPPNAPPFAPSRGTAPLPPSAPLAGSFASPSAPPFASTRAPRPLMIVVVAGVIAMIVLTIVVSASSSDQADQPGAATTPAELCKRGCALLASCDLDIPSCEQECLTDPANHRCVESTTSCEALSSCLLGTGCGSPPSGTSTCIETVTCTAACAKDDRSCSCGCMQRLDPAQSLTVLRTSVCTSRCTGDQECIARSCAVELRACGGLDRP